ncbi:uncharacterized protein LOC122500531 [Leptopilina heterotoma]|uniref:uncharacterized protein LOC122500531 n=1 Tax=Leptopilina heterotoma TaxID=63436 RepID=UPI001CA83973|nr:uncharacterized protein LOC122500531 [Leptopilina heterotoma]
MAKEEFSKKQIFQQQRNNPLNMDENILTKDWQSETKNSFPLIKSTEEEIGKRRKLLKKYFQLQAAEEIQKEELEDLPLPDSISTEYIESFCDSNFKPLMENDCTVNIQLKYPLYGDVANSLYKEQIQKGSLKQHSSICNFNQPFRRCNSFTMPPELSLQDADSQYLSSY